MVDPDPARLSVLSDLFQSIPEEMGQVLRRSAYSPNIKERLDASCAIFDDRGRMLAQAEHIPVHLGSMPASVGEVIDRFEGELSPGDQIILNDPYRGGTHLPDITLIMPVFREDQLMGYCANRAHHADVGADEPGSLPPYSHLLEDEGVVIPPYFLVRDGNLNDELLQTIRSEMRNPSERLGDLRAQIGANRRGGERFEALVKKFGEKEFRSNCRAIRSYSSRLVRKSIRRIRDGTYEGADWIESTGSAEEQAQICCSVKIRGNSVRINFDGTDPQVEGNANAPMAVTRSCCYYVLRCITDHQAPLNHGCYDMVEVEAPEETLVNPSYPRAVCSGNVETSQRIVDVLLEAFRQALPDQIPAQSQGTMNNLIIAAEGEDGTEHTYYETIGGGEGAFPFRDGEDGIHTHMTNTKNTPIEVLELTYPFRVETYKLRSGSGGNGKYRGGEGVVREITFTGSDGRFSIISERRERSPSGVDGGEAGAPGKNLLLFNDGHTQSLGPRFAGDLQPGDTIRIETPGGGGHGSPPDTDDS